MLAFLLTIKDFTDKLSNNTVHQFLCFGTQRTPKNIPLKSVADHCLEKCWSSPIEKKHYKEYAFEMNMPITWH